MNPVLILSLIIIFFTLCMSKLVFTTRVNKLLKTLNKTKFSIIIACRNEESNLIALFNSLQKIKYSPDLIEIIFVDDHSTDNTFSLLTGFCVKSVNYHAYRLCGDQQGKKYALQTGINYATNNWIIFTDADCIVHPDWLCSIDKRIQSDTEDKYSMYIGFSPEIKSKTTNYLVASFRYFKQLASAYIYAASTMAGIPFSCTARNLIFKKTVFKQTKGYDEFFHKDTLTHFKVSGDDKLLLNKFLQNKQKVSYIAYPPVYTCSVHDNLRRNQNLRRYGKFSMSSILWQTIMVIIGVLLLYTPIYIYFNQQGFKSLLIFFFTLNLFSVTGCITHKQKFYPEYLIFSIIFPYYLIYQITRSRFIKWTWKNRTTVK